MSFDWSQFLKLAEHLYSETDISSPEAEARYRTSVSRSYYSVYHIVRNFAEENDNFESYGDDHRKLQEHFIKSKGHPIRPKIGRQLRRLHQDRKKADYHDILESNPHNIANKALHEAKKILDYLDKLQESK